MLARRDSDVSSLAPSVADSVGGRFSVSTLETANSGSIKTLDAAKGTAFEGRKPRHKPVQGLQYYHKWNTDDFLGKYHRHNFKTKNFAVPGTAIVQEELRDRAKEKDVRRFEKEMEARASRRRVKMAVKNESAAVRAGITFNTMIGVPMDACEQALSDKALSLKEESLQVSLGLGGYFSILSHLI